jgi:hypothetical protein
MYSDVSFRYVRSVPTPAELDASADRLLALAARVGTGLDRVAAFHRPDVWQGAAADRFGRGLDDQRVLLRAAAEDLIGDARLLRGRAELIRSIAALGP